MLHSMLLAVTVLAAPVLPKHAVPQLEGWTRDGAAIVWQISAGGGDDGVDPMIVDYVTDMDGQFLRMFRSSRSSGDEYLDPAEALWRSAEPQSAAEAWFKKHPRSRSQPTEGPTDKSPVPGGKAPLRLGVALGPERCPTLTLTADGGPTARSLAEDRCEEREAPSPANKFNSSYRIAWSPDGTRAAIEWNVMRGEDRGIETISRTHMVILPRIPTASAPIAGDRDGEIGLVSPALGFSFSCPKSHCVDPQLELSGSIVMVSGVHGIYLHAFTLPADLSLEAAYQKELAELRGRYTLTYKRLKPGAFGVMSGQHDDEILYQKILRARSRVVCLVATYPAARKAELDPVVARIMNSYQRTPGDRMTLDADKAIAVVLAIPEVSTIGEESGAEDLQGTIERSPLPGSEPHAPEARFRVAVSDANLRHSNTWSIRFDVDAFDGTIFGYDPHCDVAVPVRKWWPIQKQLHQPGFDCRKLKELSR